MIDAHCHLDSERLEGSVEETLAEARAAGVDRILMAGTEPESWAAQRAIAAAHPEALTVFGVHPWCAGAATEAELQAQLRTLQALLTDAPPVAIGETGLDGSRLAPAGTLDAQERSFRAHLRLARDHELPVVLHLLKAHDRALRVLKEVGVPAGGIVHSFSGSAELAAEYVKLGLAISFCGSLTWPQSRKLRRAAAAVPDEALVVETDAPDQTPHPHNRERRPNRPAWLGLIVDALAQVRETTPERIAALATANTERVFRL